MAMDFGNDDALVSEINVTPLVDVMLVLLTIFIVTAPLLMNAVPVKLPKADASLSASRNDSMRISITKEGAIHLDDAPLALPQLEAKLKQAAARPSLSVEILADEKVDYGTVAKAMAAIKRAGIAKFSFVMLPEGGR